MIKQTTVWRLFGLLVLLYVLTVLAVRSSQSDQSSQSSAAADATTKKEGFELSVQALKDLNPPGCPCKSTTDCASFRCKKGKCATFFGVVPRYGDPVCYQPQEVE